MMTSPNSQLFEIASEALSVVIDAKGAELRSLRDKQGREYLWQGDTEGCWGGQAPHLFPSVGMMKEGQFSYLGKDYKINRHGFARNCTFALVEQTPSSITFELKESSATLEQYPFPFLLSITYTVKEAQLSCSLTVENTGSEILPYKIGGHPGFNCNWQEGDSLEDYELILEKKETAPRHCVDIEAALFNGKTSPFLNGENSIALTHELFAHDAIVFENLSSNHITLRRKSSSEGLRFHFSDFQQFGIWNDTKGDFVCLEPWLGHSDYIDSPTAILAKEDIATIAPGKHDTKSYHISIVKELES